LDMVAVPLVGAGGPVLLAPIEILIEDFYHQRAAWGRFGETPLRRGGHQRVERLHDGLRGVPLALLFAGWRGTFGVLAQEMTLAVFVTVPLLPSSQNPGPRGGEKKETPPV